MSFVCMITMCAGACAAIHNPAAGPSSRTRNASNFRIRIEFYDMRKLIALVSFLCLISTTGAQQKESKLFPYNYAIDDLENGLRVVTIPTDFPNMIALYIVV